jgi:hypothetical protein
MLAAGVLPRITRGAGLVTAGPDATAREAGYTKRVFSYVEIAYFEKWWATQSETVRNVTRALVRDGRLEFNLAGWTMNDEASPTYSAAISQMSEGHQFVLREFGHAARPTVGWHIDPFGHSASTASLWAQMGFDAFGLERIDEREKNRRRASQTLEFVWRGSDSVGKETQIWAHILDSHYSTPSEIAYDGTHNSHMKFDPQHAQQAADAFVKMARTRSAYYRHNLLLVPYGDDFAHSDAFTSFDQMDLVMREINAHPERYNVSTVYSDPTDDDVPHSVCDELLTRPPIGGARRRQPTRLCTGRGRSGEGEVVGSLACRMHTSKPHARTHARALSHATVRS